jgi:hypothetical protein
MPALNCFVFKLLEPINVVELDNSRAALILQSDPIPPRGGTP